MRITLVSLALLLAAPATAFAQDRTRPPPPSPAPAAAPRPDPSPSVASPSTRPPPPSASEASPPPRPPPPDPGRPPPPPGPTYGPGGWGSPPPVYYPAPLWWGYGWGWGYYPIASDPPPSERAEPMRRHRPLSTTMRATAAFGPRESGAAGMALSGDGPHGGFNVSFDVFDPSRGGITQGGLTTSATSSGFGSAHFTYPVLRGSAFLVRLEAGGSWLTVPTSLAGGTADAVGFDAGVSGHLGIVGPLGIEGHARITPYPVQVVDLRAAAAIRGGPFSFTFGYRVIDLEADSRTGPAARFEGPEIGFGLIF